MKHGLRIELIQDTQARLNQPGIEFLEAAVATAGTVTLVRVSSQKAACRRIHDGGTKFGGPVSLLMLHLLPIPTQSVIERNFLGELPDVLGVDSTFHAMEPGNVIDADVCVIQLAQGEAGEAIADAASVK